MEPSKILRIVGVVIVSLGIVLVGADLWLFQNCCNESGEQGPPGEQGAAGPTGARGPVGPPGGASCWDLNGNLEQDFGEDTNGDGRWDALDCQCADGVDGEQGPPGPPISDCNSVSFPSSDSQLSSSETITRSCPTGYFAVSVAYPSAGFLKAVYPGPGEGGVECIMPQCGVVATAIILRCCA